MPLLASVIIPTYDDWDGLQLCLDCLARQTVPPEQFEVIIANNNADPEPPANLRLPANARLVHATTPGSYAARNVALADAQADTLFFTDSDCLPDSRWIEAGLKAIAGVGPHDRVAGRVELFNTGDTWTAAGLYDHALGLQQETFSELGWCATANLVARRAAFDLVGPFGEDRLSGGDRQWGLRAQELGSKIVFSTEAFVRHPVRTTFAELAKQRRRHAGGRFVDEATGKSEGKLLIQFVIGSKLGKAFRAALSQNYTDRQRMLIIWTSFRLGWVELFEVMRLRYFSGKPNRS